MASALDVGPECAKNGISSLMLLSCEYSFPELSTVANELVLELLSFKNKHCQCTFITVHQWLKKLFGERWPEQAPTHQAIRRSVERLSARLARLKKQPSAGEGREESIYKFLQQDFVLPQLGFQRGKVVQFSPVKSKSREKAQGLRQKMYAITRNANKRLKRREVTISKQKCRIDSQHETIKLYEKNMQSTECQLSKLRVKLSRVNHRAAYWRDRVDNIKDSGAVKNTKLHQEVKLLREEVAALDSDNADLHGTIETIMSSEDIIAFEGGKYSDDVRACVYELLSLNVGVRNVGPIIRCVLHNISHQSIDRLPSYGLTCQMILESLSIAQAQLGEKLSQPQPSTQAHTLQTDGTTKYGQHFATYDIKSSKDENSCTLGIRHVFSGSAADTLDTFKEILSDIDSVQQAIGKDAVSAKVVSKIKNTMSDRHAAEKLFNELLHDYRVELLPTVAENWDSMTAVEKEHNYYPNEQFFLWITLCCWTC